MKARGKERAFNTLRMEMYMIVFGLMKERTELVLSNLQMVIVSKVNSEMINVMVLGPYSLMKLKNYTWDCGLVTIDKVMAICYIRIRTSISRVISRTTNRMVRAKLLIKNLTC